MVEVQRGAVVDDPHAVVPAQQVGVAPGPVDVRDERVEPQDPRADPLRAARQLAVVAERSRQEIDAEVGSGAGVEQVLHLFVGFVARNCRVEVEHDQAGRRQPDPLGQPAGDHLGDEHAGALSGAAELADIGAEVVALNDPGQAAALSERGDVTRDADGLEHQRASIGAI
jgi:hypothetical protein